MRLTIAMPAYNEQDCIEAAVTEALQVLDEVDGGGELLVIDDGSTDRTPELLAGLAARDGRLRIVRHEKNRGISGFNRAMMTEARGDWVLFTSSDGEYDPREAIRFIGIAEEQGADAVLGYRQDKNYDAWRHAVSFSFNALTFVCFGTRFKDIGSTRLLRRERFQDIPLRSRSAFLNAERLLVGRRRGARIVQVPIVHRPRRAGVGGGARPRKVVEAMRDLALTRLRWFRFDRFYG